MRQNLHSTYWSVGMWCWAGNVLVKAWIGSFGANPSGCAPGYSCGILLIALWGWGCEHGEGEMGMEMR